MLSRTLFSWFCFQSCREGVGICTFRFMHFFVYLACVTFVFFFLFVSEVASCDCGAPWTFHLTFLLSTPFFIMLQVCSFKFQISTSSRFFLKIHDQGVNISLLDV